MQLTQEDLRKMGAGDPLALADSNNNQISAWSIGEDQHGLSISVRPVRLGDGRHAVLIDELAGFEHLSRRHELFAVVQDKLVNVWSYAEPGHGAYSSVVIEPSATPDGADHLILIIAEPDPVDAGHSFDAPHAFTTQRLAWSANQGEMRLAPATLHLATFGPYASPEAIAARIDMSCWNFEFLVVDGRKHLALALQGKSRWVLAALSTRRAWAEAALKRASGCAPKLKVRGVEPVTLSQQIR
jgi:hypothetical protein